MNRCFCAVTKNDSISYTAAKWLLSKSRFRVSLKGGDEKDCLGFEMMSDRIALCRKH